MNAQQTAEYEELLKRYGTHWRQVRDEILRAMSDEEFQRRYPYTYAAYSRLEVLESIKDTASNLVKVVGQFSIYEDANGVLTITRNSDLHGINIYPMHSGIGVASQNKTMVLGIAEGQTPVIVFK